MDLTYPLGNSVASQVTLAEELASHAKQNINTGSSNDSQPPSNLIRSTLCIPLSKLDRISDILQLPTATAEKHAYNLKERDDLLYLGISDEEMKFDIRTEMQKYGLEDFSQYFPESTSQLEAMNEIPGWLREASSDLEANEGYLEIGGNLPNVLYRLLSALAVKDKSAGSQ